MALVLPRLLAPVFPTTYSLRYLLLTKAYTMYRHSGSPYRTFVQCKGFAPAAPRRARVSVSVPFSGLPLSWPLLIFGLVSHYLTNNLISRRPILKHRSFQRKNIPVSISYPVLATVSHGYPKL